VKIKKQLSLILMLLVVVITGVIPVSTRAQGANASFSNQATIAHESGRYKDDDSSDGDFHFYRVGDPESCRSVIEDFDNLSNDDSVHDTIKNTGYPPPNATLYLKTIESGSCETEEIPIEVATGGFIVSFRWTDAGKIQSFDNDRTRTYTRNEALESSNIRVFERDEDGECKDLLLVDPNNLERGTLRVRITDAGLGSGTDRTDRLRGHYGGFSFVGQIDYERNQEGCNESNQVSGIVLDASDAALPPGTGDDGTDPDADEDAIQCDAGPGLTWIVCGLIEFIDKAVSFIQESVIEPFLRRDPLVASGPIYDSWKGVRNLANVLLIIAFFVIIFAQASSVNIDAYTVKKMLPRLVAGAILIQLSYFIVAILNDITNILGIGLGNLVTGAALGGGVNLDINSGVGTATAIGAVIGTLVLGQAIITGSILLLLIPLLFAFLGVFFTLVMRQILITMLIILSPIAFIAWLLPGTERFFKMWWEFLIKALMMYPLIVLLFAAGSFVAEIGSTGANPPSGAPAGLEDSVGDIVAIAALIVPLALVPATFKFAGTAIAAIAGGLQKLSGRAMGGADGKGGLRKGLGAMTERRKKEVAAGTGPLLARGRYNPFAAAARNKSVVWGYKGTTRGGANIEQGAEIARMSKDMQDANIDAGALGILAQYGSYNAARRARNNGTMNAEDAATFDQHRDVLKSYSHPTGGAAAAATLAEYGMLSQEQANGAVAALRGNESLQQSLLGTLSATNARNGRTSSRAWRLQNGQVVNGIDPATGVPLRQQAATRLSVDDIIKGRDIVGTYDPATGGTGGGAHYGRVGGEFDDIFAGGGAGADNLELNLRQAIHAEEGISPEKREALVQVLQRNGRSTAQPPKDVHPIPGHAGDHQ
jgi:hypothetical protein